MAQVKRVVLVGFGVSWLIGFLIYAPTPLYRWLYIQSNQLPLETPYDLFEGADWTRPYYYADLGRSFRDLSQQANTDVIYLYLDPESNINTDAYHRYFHEYASIWAYPKPIDLVGDLDAIPSNATLIVSSTVSPALDCVQGEENLYLCSS